MYTKLDFRCVCIRSWAAAPLSIVLRRIAPSLASDPPSVSTRGRCRSRTDRGPRVPSAGPLRCEAIVDTGTSFVEELRHSVEQPADGEVGEARSRKDAVFEHRGVVDDDRSEERRVGKAWRARRTQE